MLFTALVAVACLAVGSLDGTAQAAEYGCAVPPYMEAEEPAIGPRDHFHPNPLVVLYLRSADSAQRRHDVTKIITAPGGLGVESQVSEAATPARVPAYRRIHSHDDSGVLHVEPDKGGVFRLCQLFKLWSTRSDSAHAGLPFILGKNVHVRIGASYTRNMPIDQVMQLPLNHDRPIVLFVQDAELM